MITERLHLHGEILLLHPTGAPDPREIYRRPSLLVPGVYHLSDHPLHPIPRHLTRLPPRHSHLLLRQKNLCFGL
jgi:hypothetical protein